MCCLIIEGSQRSYLKPWPALRVNVWKEMMQMRGVELLAGGNRATGSCIASNSLTTSNFV